MQKVSRYLVIVPVSIFSDMVASVVLNPDVHGLWGWEPFSLTFVSENCSRCSACRPGAERREEGVCVSIQ